MNQPDTTTPAATSGTTTRRPPGLRDVERAIALAVTSPASAGGAVDQLRGLSSPKVRAAVRERWVAPDYEAAWRALAQATRPPLRIHCLELAAASRWSARREDPP